LAHITNDELAGINFSCLEAAMKNFFSFLIISILSLSFYGFVDAKTSSFKQKSAEALCSAILKALNQMK